MTEEEIQDLNQALLPLIGVRFDFLRLPRAILKEFEPSQIGTIVGTLMDACIPKLSEIMEEHETLYLVGLIKHAGILGEREGYPDFLHASGKRLELKLLYVDPIDIEMKRPPTRREPSARLTQKVTTKNVNPDLDGLLVIAYQLQADPDEDDIISPAIIDTAVFPIIDCILARDKRLTDRGGKWFGDFETPAVLSKIGKHKLAMGTPLDLTTYGRKESEGRDFNEDTNFGKLKRIPYKQLQLFLKKHGASYASHGNYPEPWVIEGPKIDTEFLEDVEDLEGELDL
jgi:hypothetical protein